jgi:hypothetical protein
VTDVAVTNLSPPEGGRPAPPAVEVVAGVEVQALVEHSEHVIQALRQQLETALRESEDAERQVASHPAVALLGQAATLSQLDATAQNSVVAPASDGVATGPRTTVVSRPRAVPGAAAAAGPGEATGHRHSASGPGRGLAGAFKSHLVLRIGALLTVVAVLLLVFA